MNGRAGLQHRLLRRVTLVQPFRVHLDDVPGVQGHVEAPEAVLASRGISEDDVVVEFLVTDAPDRNGVGQDGHLEEAQKEEEGKERINTRVMVVMGGRMSKIS